MEDDFSGILQDIFDSSDKDENDNNGQVSSNNFRFKQKKKTKCSTRRKSNPTYSLVPSNPSLSSSIGQCIPLQSVVINMEPFRGDRDPPKEKSCFLELEKLVDPPTTTVADIIIKYSVKLEDILLEAIKRDSKENIFKILITIASENHIIDGNNNDNTKCAINLIGGIYHETPLQLSIRLRRTEHARLLIKCKNIDINKQNKNMQSPLHLAASEGDDEVVSLLLDYNAKYNIRDNKNNIPLHLAAANSRKRCCQLLLDYNNSNHKLEQLKIKNRVGETPLIKAAHNGHRECCELLLHESIVNAKDETGFTALHHAAKRGFTYTVKYLISQNADPTIKSNKIKEEQGNDKICSPISLCVSQAKKETFVELFKYYLDIYKDNPNKTPEISGFGKTLGHIAAQESIDCLEILTNALPVNYFNFPDETNNDTCLHLAIKNKNEKCCEHLLGLGVETNLINKKRETILHLAIQKDLQSVFDIIVSKHRAIIDYENADNETALLLSAKSQNIHYIKVLLKKYPRKNAVDNRGRDAVHIAAEHGNDKILKLLNKAKFTWNNEDYDRNTALHIAAMKGNLSTCKILTKYDKGLLRRYNKEKKMPIDVAFDMEHDDTFVCLLQSMSDHDESYKTPIEGIKCPVPHIHRYMHLALETSERRRKVVEAIINCQWWKYALLPFTNDYHYEGNLPCLNFNNVIKFYPDLAKAIMDKCITNDTDKNVRVYNLEIIENTFYKIKGYSELNSPFHYKKKKKNQNEDEEKECLENYKLQSDAREISNLKTSTNIMKSILEESNLDLLKHELIQNYFNRKWLDFVAFYVISLVILRLISASLFSTFVTFIWNWDVVLNKTNMTREEFCRERETLDTDILGKLGPHLIWQIWFICGLFILLSIIGLESYKFYKMKNDYCEYARFKTISKLLLVIGLSLTLLPLGFCDLKYNIREKWQWQIGIVSVLLFYIETILYLNRIPVLSVFLPVTTTFMKKFGRILFFIILFVIGFSFVFHILLFNAPGFHTLTESFIKTIVWLIGDLAYDDTFLENELESPFLVKFLFLVFVTFVAAFIANLLVSNPLANMNEYRYEAELHKYKLCIDMYRQMDLCLPKTRKKHIRSEISREIKGKIGYKERFFTLIKDTSSEMDINTGDSEESKLKLITMKLEETATKLSETSTKLEELSTRLEFLEK